MEQDVVFEAYDVEEDGLVVEEQLREEGEVLREDLVLFAIDLADRVGCFGVDYAAGWCGAEVTLFLQ